MIKHINKYLTFACLGFMVALKAFASPVPLSMEQEKQYQLAVLQEVNAHRRAKGLNLLKLDAAISAQARQHSQDMASKKMPFGHQDFDRRITHIKANIAGFAGGAENIACFKLPPRTVVQKWLTSRGHKRNIEGRYNLTGIGIVADSKGWIYYTQLFVKDNQML